MSPLAYDFLGVINISDVSSNTSSEYKWADISRETMSLLSGFIQNSPLHISMFRGWVTSFKCSAVAFPIKCFETAWEKENWQLATTGGVREPGLPCSAFGLWKHMGFFLSWLRAHREEARSGEPPENTGVGWGISSASLEAAAQWRWRAGTLL